MWVWLMVINFSLLPSPKEAETLACCNIRGWTPQKGDIAILEKYHIPCNISKPKNETFNWDAWNNLYEKKTLASGQEIWVEKTEKVLANK